MSQILLTGDGLSIEGNFVDPQAPDAVRRLRELLGPEDLQCPVGVIGSGRTGHWLRSGVHLMTQRSEAELVVFSVRFEADAGPFADKGAHVSPFRGTVSVFGMLFRGGEGERQVWSLPGVRGFGALPSVKIGSLFLAFQLRRGLGKFGKRTGARRLVHLSVSWGEPKSFPSGSSSRST